MDFATTNLTHPKELASFIDSTLLKPEARESDIDQLCQNAIEHRFRAVCVNPIYVSRAKKQLGSQSVLVAAVAGFPLGASKTETKALETSLARKEGADEIDMVLNLGWAKQALWQNVETEIRVVVEAAALARVKVILETGLLTQAEIQEACRAAERAGAHFVKTSTGFLGRGATVEDIQIMRRSCKLEIKASGGIKNFAQAKELILAGATRLGTSNGVQLVTEQTIQSGY